VTVLITALMGRKTFVFFCKKSVNWFNATFSHIFYAIANVERGRLLDATSRSPSFKSGMTSASFQTSGYVEDIRDLLIILVNGIRIVGNESFITRMWTMSGPGDLLVGMEI
jgi:hypothetical protein